MEPYVIICKSCTARLKVANEALIGQRLACPKCQSMINVIAPKGYQPPQIEDRNSESLLSGNFEDIESLLANAQPKNFDQRKNQTQRHQQTQSSPSQPNTATNRKPNAKSKLAPIAPVQTRRSSATRDSEQAMEMQRPPNASAPLPLPNSEWDSASARRRKRILQIAVLALLGITFAGTGIWALFFNPTYDPSISKNDAPAAVATLPQPAATEPSANERAQPQSRIESPTTANATNAPADPRSASGSNRSSSIGLAPPDTVDNSAILSPPPPLTADSTTPTTATTPPTIPNASSKASTTSPPLVTPPLFPDAPTESSQAEEPSTSPLIASTENSLGALSKILKGAGTSLKRIEDIAEIQKERALIGTPAYLIQRPSHREIQIRRQLSNEIAGWKLNQIPLVDALSDLEMLSDIPVTFDPEIFRDGSFDIKRPVTLQVEAVTFNEAFELLLAKDGLSIRPTQTGIVIAKPASNRTFTKSYPQSFCADENACRRLRELIIAATGINDWDAEERFQLEVLPGSVTVSHFPSHQQQIAALLQKLNAAAKYNVAPAVMRQQLQPLAMMAEDALTAAPGLDTSNPFRRSMRIGSLFRSVRQSTDLVTVIDWENLSKQGWYPNTKIPGRVNESTNRKLLNQLGHAMEATSVVVGPKTVMLTTFENAGKQIDVEVYSVGDVIDNKMTPAQLDQLMTETLGVDQLTPPNAIVIYFAECKCLVASAPQIIQRQISAIVNVL